MSFSQGTLMRPRAASFDQPPSYKTIVAIHPIDDMDNMGDTRHVAIGFETYGGTVHDYRGAVSFDRFPGTAASRFMIQGVAVKRDEDGTIVSGEVEGPIEMMELRLTSHFPWTEYQDKGKLLQFAVEQVAALIDTNIAEQQFKEEEARQIAAANKHLFGSPPISSKEHDDGNDCSL
ncbi:hypothetical protein SEMRO_703_G190190.1 [Seminavis robusta]|uniref:Uncharacterized protein n=1 Tax=Seminavis robusta TaxID=568900 RepID=A0A9N8E7H6_9STRA|nr:hypothetical protein SEMRO_703_G190190.1 [Seminavis robusta]|eukprot:Sro703_g190190.1 n/a (176) ;mRNA; r:50081-50738